MCKKITKQETQYVGTMPGQNPPRGENLVKNAFQNFGPFATALPSQQLTASGSNWQQQYLEDFDLQTRARNRERVAPKLRFSYSP